LPAPRTNRSGRDQSRADRSLWPLPDAARNLLDIARLRQQAQKLGIRKLESNEKGGVIEFNEKNNVNPGVADWPAAKAASALPPGWPAPEVHAGPGERKTRMDWVRQFMRQLEENASPDRSAEAASPSSRLFSSLHPVNFTNILQSTWISPQRPRHNLRLFPIKITTYLL
jgi:hypothetical protein